VKINMAVKKTLTKVKEAKADESLPTAIKASISSRWLTVGWTLLLLGGLAHMMPTQMAPVLGWSLWGITLQTVIGVLSVVFALYYLLED
jgi:hypothetical protein